MNPRLGIGPHGALLAAAVIFGGLGVAGKVAVREIPPGLLCLLRASFGALALHAAARLLGRGRLSGGFAVWGRLAFFSVIGVVLNQLFFLYGLRRTTATAAAILITSIPVFTASFAAILGVEAFSRVTAAGIALALGGVLLLLHGGLDAVGGSDFWGNVMIVANAALYSLYLVTSRPMRDRLDSLTMMAWIFTFGAVVVLPLGIRDALRTDFGAVSREVWWSLAYVVVFATAISYTLTIWALRHAGPTVSALYTYVQPAVTVLLAAVWLGERLTALEAAACVLVFAGVWLAAGQSGRTGAPG